MKRDMALQRLRRVGTTVGAGGGDWPGKIAPGERESKQASIHPGSKSTSRITQRRK